MRSFPAITLILSNRYPINNKGLTNNCTNRTSLIINDNLLTLFCFLCKKLLCELFFFRRMTYFYLIQRMFSIFVWIDWDVENTSMSKQVIVTCQLILGLSPATIKESEVLKVRSYISQSEVCNKMHIEKFTLNLIFFYKSISNQIMSFEEKQN